MQRNRDGAMCQLDVGGKKKGRRREPPRTAETGWSAGAMPCTRKYVQNIVFIAYASDKSNSAACKGSVDFARSSWIGVSRIGFSFSAMLSMACEIQRVAGRVGKDGGGDDGGEEGCKYVEREGGVPCKYQDEQHNAATLERRRPGASSVCALLNRAWPNSWRVGLHQRHMHRYFVSEGTCTTI